MRKENLRRKQTRRRLASDTFTCVYEIVLSASTREKQHRVYTTINAYLGAEDDTL